MYLRLEINSIDGKECLILPRMMILNVSPSVEDIAFESGGTFFLGLSVELTTKTEFVELEVLCDIL